jgi:hypothetical protein
VQSIAPKKTHTHTHRKITTERSMDVEDRSVRGLQSRHSCIVALDLLQQALWEIFLRLCISRRTE